MSDAVLSKRQLYWQRRGSLFNERASFFTHWQELSQYLLPRSGRFMISDHNRGDKRYGAIYDNTGTRSLRTLSAGLMAGMTSPARPWFRLATRDKSLMAYDPVKQWLDDTTEIMRDIFNVSNTYRALHSIYEEISAFATGCTLIEPDFDDVIHHHPLTIGEYMLAANDKGQIDTLVREYEMTVAQIVKKFVAPTAAGTKSGSPDWSRVSPMVKNQWDNGRGLDMWVPIVHIIEPRADRDLSRNDAANMAFASCYFESGANDDKLLRESGYKRFPVLAPRWEAKSGDVYGVTCPGMESLGDTKQLQHGQLRKGQAIDYSVKPPLQVPPGLKANEVNYLPGGVTVRAGSGNDKIESLHNVKIDITGQLEDIRDVRQRIEDTYYKPLFLMISQMDASGQPMTAREVAERHEEKLLMLGPVLERLHNELLKQKIDITFDRMVEARIIPPPPPEMHEQELNVEFVSMLAQAQKAIGTQAVDAFVLQMGTIAQMKPGVLDKFDEDRWADKYADMKGVDPDLIIANDKVAIIRDQRAQQQAAQAKLAQAEQMANTAKTASQADTSGQNALTDVMQGLTGYTSGAPA